MSNTAVFLVLLSGFIGAGAAYFTLTETMQHGMCGGLLAIFIMLWAILVEIRAYTGFRKDTAQQARLAREQTQRSK